MTGRRPARGPLDCGVGTERICAVVRALRDEYGEADLGNLPDPIDELVYISLTRQTHRQNARRSWQKVVDAGGPTALVDMPEADLARLIERGGFSRQKARWIKRSLEIVRERMGSLTLDGATAWNDEELEAFLRSLPGISIKSAKCIMLYSLSRAVLPVDTHVRRIAARVGLVASGISERAVHDELEAQVPRNDRYSIHVNCIWHGRKICTALRPRCDGCVISSYCAHPEVSRSAHEAEAYA